MIEAHDCSWRDGIGCINDRCPLHRGMRRLGENLKIGGALCASFRAGDNFGFHMGSDDMMQCTCQWSPGCGEPFCMSRRCEQDELYESDELDDPAGYCGCGPILVEPDSYGYPCDTCGGIVR